MASPDFLQDTLQSLMSKIPFLGQRPSIGQGLVTHTPISFEPTQEEGLLGLTRPSQPWAAYAGKNLGGIDPNTMGNITIFQNREGYTPSHVLRHELVHAVAVPEMPEGSKLYNKIKGMLPDDVADTVKWQYEGREHDPVHEGVSWLFTFPTFQGPKYNDAKMAILNQLPPATKAKITRIMRPVGPSPTTGYTAPSLNVGGGY